MVGAARYEAAIRGQRHSLTGMESCTHRSPTQASVYLHPPPIRSITAATGAGDDAVSTTRRTRIVTGRAAACLTAGLLWAGPASAGCITQIVGHTAVHNCNGKVFISQTVGATTVHHVDGRIGVSQTVGGTTVHQFDGKLGTSQTVGTTTLHNIDGKFGISQTIGNLILHSGPLFEARGQDDTAP